MDATHSSQHMWTPHSSFSHMWTYHICENLHHPITYTNPLHPASIRHCTVSTLQQSLNSVSAVYQTRADKYVDWAPVIFLNICDSLNLNTCRNLWRRLWLVVFRSMWEQNAARYGTLHLNSTAISGAAHTACSSAREASWRLHGCEVCILCG